MGGKEAISVRYGWFGLESSHLNTKRSASESMFGSKWNHLERVETVALRRKEFSSDERLEVDRSVQCTLTQVAVRAGLISFVDDPDYGSITHWLRKTRPGNPGTSYSCPVLSMLVGAPLGV